MNHYIFHAKSNNHHFPAFMDMIQRYMKAGLLHAQRSCTCCCGPMRLAFLPWPIRPNHFNLGEFQSLANQEVTVPYSRYHDDLYWVCHSCWNYIHYTTVSDIEFLRTNIEHTGRELPTTEVRSCPSPLSLVPEYFIKDFDSSRGPDIDEEGSRHWRADSKGAAHSAEGTRTLLC